MQDLSGDGARNQIKIYTLQGIPMDTLHTLVKYNLGLTLKPM